MIQQFSPKYILKIIESRGSDTCTLTFIAAFFTIDKRWKQPKCPSVDEWINKMWSVHTMEYY